MGTRGIREGRNVAEVGISVVAEQEGLHFGVGPKRVHHKTVLKERRTLRVNVLANRLTSRLANSNYRKYIPEITEKEERGRGLDAMEGSTEGAAGGKRIDEARGEEILTHERLNDRLNGNN